MWLAEAEEYRCASFPAGEGKKELDFLCCVRQEPALLTPKYESLQGIQGSLEKATTHSTPPQASQQGSARSEVWGLSAGFRPP